jgi:transcriptional regulator GlxA family with amidase domain
MPLERAGGQAQFIVHEPPAPSPGSDGASLEPLQRWIEANLHRPLTLQDLARKAAMSTRTLNRRFREQVGTTPLQWLLRRRVRRAQQLLETTGQSVEQVATRAGFGSAAALRDRFGRVVGTGPRSYRDSFRSAAR